MEDSLPEEYLLSPKYFVGAEFNVLMGDRGSSSIESELWKGYLIDFPGESLLPMKISTNGSNSLGDGDLCGEDFTDRDMEDWAKIFMPDRKSQVAKLNRGIDEPFLENLTMPSARLALSESWIDWGPVVSDAHAASSDPWMDWEEWSKLIDDQQRFAEGVTQQPKIRQRVCKERSRGSANTKLQPQPTRRGPTRGGVIKVLRHIKKDCWPQLLVKFKGGENFADLLKEWV
ncbi:hypothetical protein V502_04579 [Pseudogymnoascus sp. VKM F-4520 (FW-2644)]|nr:hypothetical protein V502_04579 [Pseudogymnoascus sp. VKM F-4520 (FW-2644)]